MIQDTSPILRIIYAPALDELYYNPMGKCSIKKSQKREYLKRKIDINHITLFTSDGDMITEHYLKENLDFCSKLFKVVMSIKIWKVANIGYWSIYKNDRFFNLGYNSWAFYYKKFWR